MFGLGAKELLILAGVFVLFFGAEKIPELARSIGEAARHLKNAFSDKEKVGITDKKR